MYDGNKEGKNRMAKSQPKKKINKKFPSNKGTNRNRQKNPMMKGKKEQKDLLAE